MPQGMHRLNGGGNHVFNKMTCLPRKILAGHVFMVAKTKLVPSFLHLYNLRNAASKTDLEPMALNLHHSSRVAPDKGKKGA